MRNRNVFILTITQALASTAGPLVTLVGGIVGAELAPNPAWATLPITIMILGVAVCTIPAAMLMKRVGRKRGFIIAMCLASVATLGTTYALHLSSFPLFCLGMVFIGATNSFVGQFRFAAAESVEPRFASRAVSMIMFGGIIAGFLGPEIGKRTRDLLPLGAYTGAFFTLALLYLVVAGLLALLHPIVPKAQAAEGEERPLSRIILQPTYLVAVLAGMVAYGVMSFIMTATPISMHVHDGFTLDATTTVIQSHVIAMFVPSLFAGLLIERLGAPRVMLVGVLALSICVAIATLNHQWLNYWSALVLLGVGWNFLYMGGTILLTRTYRVRERFKAQAFNDFSVFGVQALASLTAGAAIHAMRWDRLVLLPIPILGLMALAVLLVARRRAPVAQSSLPAAEGPAPRPDGRA